MYTLYQLTELVDRIFRSLRTKVSSTHLKTINGQSLFADTGGDITISAGSNIQVDPTPTSGSVNAVSSGGTYSSLQNLSTLYEAKNSNIQTHIANTANPHNVTKAQVGLVNVDNTSDVNKPIGTATQTALNSKQASLVSGTNIKTINSNSILGNGDITIPFTFDRNLVILNNSTTQTIIGSTYTRLIFNNVITDTKTAFDTTSNEYVVPATGIYAAFLRVRLRDNAGASRSYGIGVGLTEADGIDFSWKNTERTASINRNTAQAATFLSLTSGQRIKGFMWIENTEDVMSCSLTVYRIQ